MKRDRDLKKLGRLLRKARNDQAIPIRKLSKDTGVSQGSIIGLEQAEYQSVNPDKLRSLASVLGLNSHDLFAIAGLLPDDEQPTISGLLHLNYRSLPDEAVDEIQSFVDYQVRKHSTETPRNQQKAS